MVHRMLSRNEVVSLKSIPGADIDSVGCGGIVVVNKFMLSAGHLVGGALLVAATYHCRSPSIQG